MSEKTRQFLDRLDHYWLTDVIGVIILAILFWLLWSITGD